MPQPQHPLDLEGPLPPTSPQPLPGNKQRKGDQTRIAELERRLGRATLPIEVLKMPRRADLGLDRRRAVIEQLWITMRQSQ